MIQDSNLEIVKHTQLASSVYQIELSGDYRDYAPGQFVQLEITDSLEPFLRRPLSICEADGNILKIVYRVFGRGTKLLSQKKIGETVKVLGPLGVGFPVNTIKKANLIGGGIGVPPLLGLAKKMNLMGIETNVLLGFNTKDQAILLDEFSSIGSIQIASLDGSIGRRGYVTDLIEDRDTLVYACGPEPLYRALENLNLRGYYSLERRMACGLGVCLGCNITVIEKNTCIRKRVCHDGPVFPIGSVRWGEQL